MQVRFYLDAYEDEEASAREGRPMYRDIEKVRISGMRDAFGQIDNTTVIDTKATDQHRQRFAKDYAEFRSTTREAVQGTPLKMWPAASLAVVKSLSSFGIVTVEQLAEVEAKELRLHEWLKPWHEKAVSWLKSLTDNGEVLRLEQQVRELDRKVASVEAEKTELLRELIELRKADKKRTAKVAE